MSSALAILGDPYVQVTYLFVTGVAAIYCLIGLWAATSRRHWFLRAIVPCLALAALIPIRAHEPLIFYALVMAEIVAAITLWRWWRRRGNARQVTNLSKEEIDSGQVENLSQAGSFRFSLRDLLLLMVVVGVIAWIVTGFAGVGLLIEWPGAIGASMLLAALTLCASILITAPHKRPAIGLLLLTLIAAVTIDVTLLGNWLKMGSFLHTGESLSWWRNDAVIRSFLDGEFTAIILLTLAISRTAFDAGGSKISHGVYRLTLALMAVAAAVPLATFYWRMTGIPDFPPPVRLDENVYPQVLEIGAPMETVTPAKADAIYKQLLPLLNRQGHLSVDMDLVRRDPIGLEVLPRAQRVRSIARAMDARGSTLAARGERDEAARCAISTLRMAKMQMRGGLALDKLVGEAVESVGRHRMIVDRDKFSAEMKRVLVRFLQDFDRSREDVKIVRQRDDAYYSRTTRWLFALEQRIPFFLFGLSKNGGGFIDDQLVDSQRRHQAACRLLFTDLAARSFREEHGALPPTLADLVPEYLAAVPVDPYADKALVYRPQGKSFILYSVGPDRIDNGGTPIAKGQNIRSAGIDWDLDSLVAP